MLKNNKIVSAFLIIAMVMQLFVGITFAEEREYFEFTIPDMRVESSDEWVTIENIQEYAPEEMQFGFVYASDAYGEYITNPVLYTFENIGYNYEFVYHGHPLKCMTYGGYNLEIPVPERLESGVYSLLIELDIAQYKDADDVKPYKIRVENFMFGDVESVPEYYEWNLPDAEGVVNDSTVINGIKNLVPDYMQDKLMYASDSYASSITDKPAFTFWGLNGNTYFNTFISEDMALYKGNGEFYLKIPFYEEIPSGEYKVMIELGTAYQKGIKPFKFVIKNYKMNNPSIPEDETTIPTEEPTIEPTTVPTVIPSEEPSAEPTVIPSVEPTTETTPEPTEIPTVTPSAQPTQTPTVAYYECDITEDISGIDFYAGETVYLESIQNFNGIITSSYIGRCLSHLSDKYSYQTRRDAELSFINAGYCFTSKVSLPIKSTSNNNEYNMEFTVPSELMSGIYDIVLEVYPSENTSLDWLKPCRFNMYGITVSASDESEYFEFELPDAEVYAGEVLTFTDVQDMVPDAMKFGLIYASDYYEDNILMTPFFRLFNINSATGGAGIFELDEIPLKMTHYDDMFDLEIPISEEISAGEYRLGLELGIASEKGSDNVKPFRFIINHLTVKEAGSGEEHSWDDGEIVTGATCTGEGLMKYTCLCGCGDTKFETISPLGHNFSASWAIDKEPTCTEEGSESRHCTRCTEKTDVYTIPKTDHSYCEWYVEQAPTSTENGVRVHKCTACSYKETEEISALGYKNTTFNIADTVNLLSVSGAEVFVYTADGSINLKAISDEEGKAEFDLANGVYSVQIIANGYQIRNFTIEKQDDESVFDAYLNKNDVLSVSTTVKEMSRQEIIDAGIDIDAVENKHIFKCATVFKFTPVDEGSEGGEFNIIEINFDYICDEEGTIIDYKPVEVGGAKIYPVSRDIYLIIHSETTWLKEMFDVELVVANTSSAETIKDVVANIELPEGLSLAAMVEDEQSFRVEIPDIAPGCTDSIHWYVRGDKEGVYRLNGEVSAKRVGGGITEALNASFVTKEPITVLAGNAMKLVIEAEKFAYPKQPYKVRYTLQNVSNKTLNDVELEVLGGKFMKAYNIQDVIHEALLGDTEHLWGSFNDNIKLKKEEFLPGEVLSGVFTITFGLGVYTEQDVKYMVTDMFTITGNGSTTQISTEIILVDNVIEHKWDECYVKTEPTCTSDGEMVYTCSKCGDTMITIIPMSEHTYGEWVEKAAPTCTSKGVECRVCINCDDEETILMPMTSHSWDNGVITKHSTKTEHGTRVRSCIDCENTKTEQLELLADNGTVGTNGAVEWLMYEDGTFVLDGIGSIEDFGSASGTPWVEYQKEITEVIIEDGVTQIGTSAFAKCSNLKSVTLGKDVISIKNRAFKDCENLVSIVLPDGVRNIGKNAFANCVSLKEINIPAAVNLIKEDAFAGCISLDNIYYGAGRDNWEKMSILTGNEALKDEYIYYEIPSVRTDAENISVYAPKEECVLLVATYENNVIVDKKIVPVNSSIENTLQELGIDTTDANKVKVFLWDNAQSLVPLCNSADADL